MIRMGTAHVETVPYADVATIARLPHVRYRERGEYLYAVKKTPLLGRPVIYRARVTA
jgi:hypothetical protein